MNKKQVKFTASDHSYKRGDTPYTSVTTVIGKYKNPFDKDFWSSYKAFEAILTPHEFSALKRVHRGRIKTLKFLKSCASKVQDKNIFLRTKESILKDWDRENKKAIDKGNKYHKDKEVDSYVNGFEINPVTGKQFTTFKNYFEGKDGENNMSITPDMGKLPDAFYPELLIWNDDYQIAGQADKVFITTIDGVRYVDIDDYKGLALDTPILTYNKGWSFMGDLHVGDIVYGGDSKQARIEHVSEVHHNPCYSINFYDTETIIADHEHKWVVVLEEGGDEVVRTTEELFNLGLDAHIKIKHNTHGYVYIFSILSIPMVPTKCIAVDSKDHTYLAGRTLIKTHNTNKAIKKESFRSRDGKYAMMQDPLDLLMDTNFVHYELQISTYAWMMAQYGFVVRNLTLHHFEEMHKLRYLKEHVEEMLHHFKMNSDV